MLPSQSVKGHDCRDRLLRVELSILAGLIDAARQFLDTRSLWEPSRRHLRPGIADAYFLSSLPYFGFRVAQIGCVDPDQIEAPLLGMGKVRDLEPGPPNGRPHAGDYPSGPPPTSRPCTAWHRGSTRCGCSGYRSAGRPTQSPSAPDRRSQSPPAAGRSSSDVPASLWALLAR